MSTKGTFYMGRKAKFSKEIKIKACEKYRKGKGSFKSISEEIGCGKAVFYKWYHDYVNHGESVFDEKPRNNSYTAEFKLEVINEIKKSSIIAASSKFGISREVVRKWFLSYNNGETIKDYSPCSEVYTMKARKTTFEERIEIVNFVLENDNDYKGAADTYSVPYASVYQWVQKYLKHGEESLRDSRGRPKTGELRQGLTELEKKDIEIERLKRELERHKRAEEILKKNLEIRKQMMKNSRK